MCFIGPVGGDGKALALIKGFEKKLIYTSCYPSYGSEQPEAIAARLPEPWLGSVFRDNALSFFRWPTSMRERS